MPVIEATSGTYRSRVDGTLVLSVEIEPRHAQAALALFGMPGQPMALAALKTGQGMAEPEKAAPEPKEGPRRASTQGEICKWLAMRCREAGFQRWAVGVADEAECAEHVRALCGVESRSHIDGDPKAEALFKQFVQGPWAAYQRKVAA